MSTVNFERIWQGTNEVFQKSMSSICSEMLELEDDDGVFDIQPKQAESLEAKVSEAVQTYVQSLNYCLGDKPIHPSTLNDSFDHYELLDAFTRNTKGHSTLHSHIFKELQEAVYGAPVAMSAIKTYAGARKAQSLAKSTGKSDILSEQINKVVKSAQATASEAMLVAKSKGTAATFLMCAELERGWLDGASSRIGNDLAPLAPFPVQPVRQMPE